MIRTRIISVFAAAVIVANLSAQDKMPFIPEQSFSAGMMAAAAGLNSDNIELLLLVNRIYAKGNATLVAPFVEYSYADDKSIGARLVFFNGKLELDGANIDLLNEGLEFDLSGISLGMKLFGGSLYHRHYYSLDKKRRLAAYTELTLSALGGNSGAGDSGSRSSLLKGKLSFSPGLMFFVMNNVSVNFSMEVANISYTCARNISEGENSGKRTRFNSGLGPDLTGLRFGINFYF